MLAEAGADVEAVWAEVDSGRPLATVEKEHTAYVESHNVWGVPTFIVGDRAVFVRLMSLPDGDGELAISTVNRILDQIDWPMLNEFKHTSDPALKPSLCDARRVAEGQIDDRRMSDAEGLMWRLEKDPYLTSTFGTVSLLDRPPDFDRLRARMERAVAAVPRLGWRVQPAPVNLSAPLWVDDPDFEIDQHVRRIALPKPGTMRQLLDLATLLVVDPFDRTRPLWQFIVVEGLRGGKAALIQKMHHTITDGEGGVQMSLQYLDFERDAPDPPPLERTANGLVGAPPSPSTAEALRDLFVGGFRLPLSVAKQVRDLLDRPDGHPHRQHGGGRHGARGRVAAVGHRGGSFAAVDAAQPEAAVRDGARLVPADQGRRQAARRHAEHGVPHRRRRGRLPLPPGAR